MMEIPKPSTNTQGKPYDLRDRTFECADRVLHITGALPGVREAEVVRYQLSKSGTSVGAVSKAETRRAFVIAIREAREARYWLRLIKRNWSKRVDVTPDVSEATEIIHILSTIIKKLS